MRERERERRKIEGGGRERERERERGKERHRKSDNRLSRINKNSTLTSSYKKDYAAYASLISVLSQFHFSDKTL